MKLLDYQKETLVNGMLAMLNPDATETQTEMVEIMGYLLRTEHGIHKDKHGAPINDFIPYTYPRKTTEAVNHKQKICQLIADAQDEADMTDKLGAYLAKYAKDKNEVVRSIPPVISLNNNYKSKDN